MHLQLTKVIGLILTLTIGCVSAPMAWAAKGQLEIRVVDDAAQPMVARMHVWDARQRPRRPKRGIGYADHFVVDGSTVLNLVPGTYTFRIERGMEYPEQTGHFVLQPGARDNKQLVMKRFVDMAALGWRSGDIDVTRRPGDLAALSDSEDLHILENVPLASSTAAATNHVRVSADVGGRLIAYNVQDESISDQPRYSGELLRDLRPHPNAIVHAEDVLAWDLPMWIASRRLDTVTVLVPTQPLTAAAKRGRPDTYPRDERRFPGDRGLGRWREEVYFRLLEAGIRVAPVAVSQSGQRQVPVGACRTYAFVGDQADELSWWTALRQSATILTAGPLMTPQANGELPGHVFAGIGNETLEINVRLTLNTREKISYFQIIKNGTVEQEVRLEEWVAKRGQLPPVVFNKSGWMVLRAVIDRADAYRYVMTAPYWVEFEGTPRIRRSAAEFFLGWAEQRREQMEKSQRPDIVRFHQAAVRFWQRQIAAANVEE